MAMRTLKECTAEVLRRSEKRIKASRRKRNCILALCVSLCLVVAVWVAATVRVPEKAALLRVEVRNAADGVLSVISKEDAEEIERIYDSVRAALAGAGENTEATTEPPGDLTVDEDYVQYVQNVTYASFFECEMIFTGKDGARETYFLSGNRLRCESTGQESLLTEERRTELLNMLGLTIQWEEEK